MMNCLMLTYLLYGCTASKLETLGVTDVEKRYAIARDVDVAALRYNVPTHVILGVMKQESGFNNKAVSSSGAYGYMQVLPKYWRKSCPAYKTPDGNISCGAMILRSYYNQTGSWKQATIAYNIGITNYNNRLKMSAGIEYAYKVGRYSDLVASR